MHSTLNTTPPPPVPQAPNDTYTPGRYSKAFGVILMVFCLVCINYGAWDFYGQLTRAEQEVLEKNGLNKAPEVLLEQSFSALETKVFVSNVKDSIGRNVALFAIETTFFSVGLVVGFFIFLNGDRRQRRYIRQS